MEDSQIVELFETNQLIVIVTLLIVCEITNTSPQEIQARLREYQSDNALANIAIKQIADAMNSPVVH
ncbi:hypothetical protein E1B77_20780 [Salmonella enterica subsp. enterica]|nr:hypothetical protein [Salmonella enterica subsp. enterica]